MERSKAEAVIEAILFTMGDSVEISRLAEVAFAASPPVFLESADFLRESFLVKVLSFPDGVLTVIKEHIPSGQVER